VNKSNLFTLRFSHGSFFLCEHDERNKPVFNQLEIVYSQPPLPPGYAISFFFSQWRLDYLVHDLVHDLAQDLLIRKPVQDPAPPDASREVLAPRPNMSNWKMENLVLYHSSQKDLSYQWFHANVKIVNRVKLDAVRIAAVVVSGSIIVAKTWRSVKTRLTLIPMICYVANVFRKTKKTKTTKTTKTKRINSSVLLALRWTITKSGWNLRRVVRSCK
jgi:hypothetical protein